MKKLIGLVCSCAMLFSLVACGGSKIDDKALDLFEDAILNAGNMKSADLSMKMKIISIPMDTDLALNGKFINKDGSQAANLSVDMKIEGEVKKDFMKLYLKDKMLYMNMMDVSKQKQPMDLSTFNPVKDDGLKKGDIKKSSLKKLLKEATIDGSKIDLVFDGDKVKEVMQGQEKDKTDDVTAAFKKVSFDRLEIQMDIKNKMMQSTKVILESTGDIGGKKTEIKYIFDIKFKNINKIETIDFPDFTDYTVSEQGLPLLGQ